MSFTMRMHSSWTTTPHKPTTTTTAPQVRLSTNYQMVLVSSSSPPPQQHQQPWPASPPPLPQLQAPHLLDHSLTQPPPPPPPPRTMTMTTTNETEPNSSSSREKDKDSMHSFPQPPPPPCVPEKQSSCSHPGTVPLPDPQSSSADDTCSMSYSDSSCCSCEDLTTTTTHSSPSPTHPPPTTLEEPPQPTRYLGRDGGGQKQQKQRIRPVMARDDYYFGMRRRHEDETTTFSRPQPPPQPTTTSNPFFHQQEQQHDVSSTSMATVEEKKSEEEQQHEREEETSKPPYSPPYQTDRTKSRRRRHRFQWEAKEHPVVLVWEPQETDPNGATNSSSTTAAESEYFDEQETFLQTHGASIDHDVTVFHASASASSSTNRMESFSNRVDTPLPSSWEDSPTRPSSSSVQFVYQSSSFSPTKKSPNTKRRMGEDEWSHQTATTTLTTTTSASVTTMEPDLEEQDTHNSTNDVNVLETPEYQASHDPVVLPDDEPQAWNPPLLHTVVDLVQELENQRNETNPEDSSDEPPTSTFLPKQEEQQQQQQMADNDAKLEQPTQPDMNVQEGIRDSNDHDTSPPLKDLVKSTDQDVNDMSTTKRSLYSKPCDFEDFSSSSNRNQGKDTVNQKPSPKDMATTTETPETRETKATKVLSPVAAAVSKELSVFWPGAAGAYTIYKHHKQRLEVQQKRQERPTSNWGSSFGRFENNRNQAESDTDNRSENTSPPLFFCCGSYYYDDYLYDETDQTDYHAYYRGTAKDNQHDQAKKDCDEALWGHDWDAWMGKVAAVPIPLSTNNNEQDHNLREPTVKEV